MAAVCIVVNTTSQTVLVVGSPPPVMRVLFADGMDGATGYEQHATRHFEMFAASVPLAECWWMGSLRPVPTHPPQTEMFESNVDDPHHVLAPNKGKTLQRIDTTVVQYLLVYM